MKKTGQTQAVPTPLDRRAIVSLRVSSLDEDPKNSRQPPAGDTRAHGSQPGGPSWQRTVRTAGEPADVTLHSGADHG